MQQFLRRIALNVPICMSALFLLLTLATPAHARSWSIADYSATIAIDESGSALVIEHITCTFAGQYNGIIRKIPIEYPGPHGTNFTLYLDVQNVTDEDGNKLKYELSSDGDYRKIKIYIPGAVDAKKQVNIAYRVKNAIRHFDDFDEFYWNVTGLDWPVPIEHASASVALPESAAGQGLRAQAFTGSYGSKESEATSSINGARIDFETTNPLPMRGGLTIDIYIPKGIVRQPGVLKRLFWFIGSNPILFLPLMAFVVMYSLWSWKGKDPDPGMSVAPTYQPPENITPAEAGTLLGDTVHQRDITSTLVHLAVRGYLKIVESEEHHLFLKSKDYTFQRLKPASEWANLELHERTMLENMFQGGELCSLSSLKNHFYTAIPVMKESILQGLKRKGMYGLDPQSAGGYDLLGVVLIAAPFVLLQFTGLANFALSGWLLIPCFVLAAAIVIVFARIMPAKSLRGARTVVGIRGFQEFMNRVEGDRLRSMPSDTFEKCLPYAMALGVEEHWAHAFQGILQQPPQWYQGSYGGNFDSMLFTHSISSMADSAGAAFVSAPRASSSGSGFGGGGFSDGGFSGGGFGGGGGDAF